MIGDLHIHTRFSDGSMGIDDVVFYAKRAGLDFIAITDHDTMAGCTRGRVVGERIGIQVLAGVELSCFDRERGRKVHLLCYLPTVEAALALSREIYALLPDIPCDEAVFGEQIVMDEEDHELQRVEKLLVSACGMGLEEAAARCAALGGVAVPAHVDRESYSVLSVLGIMPEAPVFPAVEVHDPARLPPLVASGRLPDGYEILTSSDAHYLEDIATAPHTLAEGSCLERLIRGLR